MDFKPKMSPIEFSTSRNPSELVKPKFVKCLEAHLNNYIIGTRGTQDTLIHTPHSYKAKSSKISKLVNKSTSVNTRQGLTMRLKKRVVELSKQERTHLEIANLLSIGRSTVTKILSNKKFIEQGAFDLYDDTRMRVRSGAFNELELDLFRWCIGDSNALKPKIYSDQIEENEPSTLIPIRNSLTRKEIIEKANLLAKEKYLPKFTGSNAWFFRFKRKFRLNIAPRIKSSKLEMRSEVKPSLIQSTANYEAFRSSPTYPDISSDSQFMANSLVELGVCQSTIDESKYFQSDCQNNDSKVNFDLLNSLFHTDSSQLASTFVDPLESITQDLPLSFMFNTNMALIAPTISPILSSDGFFRHGIEAYGDCSNLVSHCSFQFPSQVNNSSYIFPPTFQSNLFQVNPFDFNLLFNVLP